MIVKYLRFLLIVMATATLLTLPGEDRFFRISMLLIDVGTTIVRGLFDSIHHPSNLANVLQVKKSILSQFKSNNILSQVEWNKLFPSSSSYGKSADFDLTLLLKLLRNICNLTAPSTGWHRLPMDTDLSLEADIVRVKNHRNETFAFHDTELSEDEFDNCWYQIKGTLLRIVGRYSGPFNIKEWEDQIDSRFMLAFPAPEEIKARGTKAVNAYRRALQQGSVVVYRGRIMLVGQEGAGKTSLKKSLLGLPFNPGEESTVGVEVDPSFCCVDVDDVKNWQRTDHAHFVSNFADNVARFIADDLKQVEEDDFKQDEQQHEKAYDGTKDLYVRNEGGIHQPETPSEDKPDIPAPEVIPEHVTQKLIQYLQGLNLNESSTEPEIIMSIWDFAGQHLYYASHPVFMSARAVYLLVYNLSKDLNVEAEPRVRQGAHGKLWENDNHTNLETLLSWLVSIHNIRQNGPKEGEADLKKVPGNHLPPPVIMVGTNADQPFENPEKMETLIKKSLSGKKYQQHLIKPFFTVDNTLSSPDKGIQLLQKKIIEVFGMEPYMKEPIPVRWLSFEKVIQTLVEAKMYHLAFTMLEDIITEVCFIDDRDEICAMLDFYHDLGVIIKHGDRVVLQAQWLIDLFRKLITVRPYDDQDHMFEEWNDLEDNGILRMELVDHVFNELLDSDQSKEDLLGMMEHYGLIAAFNKVSDTREVCYFVPAQLTSSPKELLYIQPSPTGPCALYIHFVDGFVPHGLYSFIVSKFIAWCFKDGSPHEPNLFRSASRYIIGKSSDYELVLICCKRYIKVILRSLQANELRFYEPAVSIRKFIESTLQGISDEYQWYRSLRYQLAVLCPSCSKSSKPCKKHRVAACSNDDCVHLLEVRDPHQVMVCTKSFGEDARPEVQNFEVWYSSLKENTSTTDVPTSLGLPLPNPDSDEVYKMKSSPRGLMVIVNMENFPKKKSKLIPRKGSEKDVEELTDLFSRYLDFRVRVMQDKPRGELWKELSDIAVNPDNARYDCLAVCIMTHGEDGYFNAADGHLLEFKNVYAMFTNTQCEAFDQKPKLFFIQACRGNKGIEPSNDSPIDGSETTSQAQQNAADRNDSDMSDILMAYSSYEGYVSHRNHKTGSIFIQSLVRVFRQYADKEHIGDLLTRVNLEVYNTVHGVEGRPQVPSPTSTLKKRLYFWPGVKFDH